MLKMKTILISFITIAVLTCSCNDRSQKQSSSQKTEDSTQRVQTNNLNGQWNIENIVVNDSLCVHPSEENPSRSSYIIFDNGIYSIMTDCNHIQGTYSLKGDSIVMHDGMSTEMACENMLIEDLLKKAIPDIRTVDFVNDSVMRLNSETLAYIILSRLKEPLK